MLNFLRCHHFDRKDCQSCQWLDKSYPAQINDKVADLKRLISPFILQKTQVFPPLVSSASAFRNKAKMVVSGSVERPLLGILREQTDPSSAVDLTDCPLYPSEFVALFPVLKDFIARAGLVPYNVAKKKGGA